MTPLLLLVLVALLAHNAHAAAPKELLATAKKLQPALQTAIAKNRYQPFCVAFLACLPDSAQDLRAVRTITPSRPTTVSKSDGPKAFQLSKVPGSYVAGYLTYIVPEAIATETTTSTTSITVGKITQTNTVTKTATVTKKAKRDNEHEKRALEERAPNCPSIPTGLRQSKFPGSTYSTSEWNYIIEYACAPAVGSKMAKVMTRTSTDLAGVNAYTQWVPTTTYEIPESVFILGTSTITKAYTTTTTAQTYVAVFSYTTKTATVTTTSTVRA